MCLDKAKKIDEHKRKEYFKWKQKSTNNEVRVDCRSILGTLPLFFDDD